MISNNEFQDMINELRTGVVLTCKDCASPLILEENMDFEKPENCICQCGKVKGVCVAILNMLDDIK